MYGKRVLPIIISILLVPLLAGALSADDIRVSIGTGNDKFSMGVSKNDDDWMTFDFPILVQAGPFSLEADAIAFTDRAAGTRYDQLSIDVSWAFIWNVFDGIALRARPVLGLDYIGNLNLEVIQNWNHAQSGVKPVSLKYPDNGVMYHVFGLKASLGYGFDDASDVSLNLFPRYEKGSFSLDAGISVRYRGMKFGLAYPWRIQMAVDAGIASFSYWKDLGSTFGYGTFVLDVMGFFRKSTWSHSDAVLSIGTEPLQSFVFLSNTLSVSIGDKLSLTVLDRYTSGFPINKDLDESERVQRNHTQLALGCSYEIFDFHGCKSYVGASGGLAVWQMDQIFTDGRSRIVFDSLITPFACFRLGVNLIPEGLLRFDSTSVSVDVAVDFNYFFSPARITDYVLKDLYHKPDFVFKPFSVSLFIGVRLGLDLGC